ncbi:hypothetical protein ACFQJ7_08735 [Halovenus rubra]|uniref:Uncharacterized protein n=2 Tax=Halovenus rubra TaxID=869890 RepID=A0ACC7E3X9_9EURY|nr:hypothetical protein [Halovenus rubra]
MAPTKIKFRSDGSYREQLIKNEEPDSWIDIRIRVGEEYIYGGPDSYVTGFACGFVLNLLDSVSAMKTGERSIIELEYGPTWLTIDPVDQTAVRIAACRTYKGAMDSSERLEIDDDAVVSKEAWESEVLRTAREFHETVVDVNPDLQDQEVIADIRDRIDSFSEE